MALPKTKQELADWVLRRLGAPVVNVEITNEQLEDAIDQAVQMYYEWHYDGTQRSYRSIKITNEMLLGNDRKHQELTAPMYDVTIDNNYRVGSRVMTYNAQSNPDKIWIKYDSETLLYQYNYIVDPVGAYYHPDTSADTKFFITLDSAKYLDSDFVIIDSDLGTYQPNPNVVSDSDGGFISYDSDLHNVFVYTVDSDFGLWVDSDSNFVSYDSDIHSISNSQRYSRNSVVNGLRYDRIVVKQFEKEYVWADLWKEETAILAQPVVTLDYSKEGQVGIPIPENIYGISKVFRINSMQSLGMWSYEYQMFLNNFDWFYGSGGAAPGALTTYYTTKMNIDFIDFMLNTQPAIRFNKHKNRLYIDTSWMRLERSSGKDHYLLAEVYEISDPEIYGDVYSDKWLHQYTTALAKIQWGSNLKKYTGTQLPGGITIQGQDLYDEGYREKTELEDKLKSATSALFDSIIIG